jgi:diguanylate cyclase (GGDEF)-like protein
LLSSGILFAAGGTAGIAAGVAASVSLLAVGVALVAARRLRRARGSSEERAAELLRELDQRLRRLGEDLSEELERTREESRRSRYLGELAWTIEFEDVLRRTLDAAVQLDRVDAAMITVLDAAGEVTTKAIGLTDEEQRQLAIEPPPRSPVQSMTIVYTRDPGAPAAEPPVARSVSAPIHSGSRTIGIVSVFSRDEFTPFPDETLEGLEDLATRAGPALENARRFQEARRQAERDAKTGLHNERHFADALRREVARARRDRGPLALLVFDLDDFRQFNDRFGHDGGDKVLRVVAERLTNVLRSADIACRLGGAADEFGVILHDATLEQAMLFYARLRDEIEAEPVEGIGRISFSTGVAQYDGREDPEEFVKRADEALYQAKRAGKGGIEPAG